MTMKHSLYILSIVLFTLLSCKTQKVDIGSPLLETPKLENALLWKIEGKELTEPSYLFGTVHIIPKDKFFYPEGTLSAFDQSKKVFLEFDMSGMQDMSTMMTLLPKLYMKDNMTVKDLVSKEDYAMLSEKFAEVGLPMPFLDRIKPIFLSMMAGNGLDPKKMQSGEMISYEMEFAEMAEKSSKEMGGLETMDYQIAIFDSIPYKDQAKMLVEAFKGGSESEKMMENLYSLYIAQDIETMASSIVDEEPLLEDHSYLFLEGRNKNWIPVIAKEAKAQPSFFAVGAGHLGGKTGVINLLKKEGYTVTPIAAKK